MKGRQIRYSPEQLAWVKACCDLPRTELHALFTGIWSQPEVSVENLKSLCSRNGWSTGRTGCFAPGQTPVNKGQKMAYNANSAATRFKRGDVPPNRKPLWSERPDGYGYLEIKVPVQNPYTGHSTRYMHKHRWNWEQVNGPLPSGMALKCLNGDRHDCAADNWEAIPRALLPRLNGRFGRDYDNAPAELKPTLLTIAKLEHRARELTKEATT